MPKLKTRKSIAKRFKITKTGKVKCSKAFKGHLLGRKSRKRKRALSRGSVLNKTDARKIKAMLPYG
ncbi:MAG: 50S ribosomal protein L35 [Candidatus Omnitrophota bacterium]